MVKLIVDCNKIKPEVAIKLFNDIIERIKERKLETYVSCEIKEK